MGMQPVPAVSKRAIRGRVAFTQVHEAYAFPAPTLGVDARQSLAMADPQTAASIENMFVRGFGLELRAGYQRWNGVLSATGSGITLMPFVSASDPAASKLFMAASDGKVYDVTTKTLLPAVAPMVLDVPGQTVPGEAYWVNAVTQAGSFLCVVFPGAGYWTYDNTTGWVQHTQGAGAGQVDGIDPAKFGYILAWQNRLIFIETGTSNAWYLPVYQIAGAATVFEFGMLFTRGGYLAVAAPWTSDSGDGVFSRLVLISSEGDVLIYSGADPDDAASFTIEGRWYIGRVPIGRRFITRFGADMAVLSERGLVLMSDVLRGNNESPDTQAARRVNPLLQPDISASLDARFWEVRMLSEVNALIVNSPVRRFNDDFVWAFDQTTFGASKMTNMPFYNMETFEGKTFATDDAGNVWELWVGETDGAVGAVPGVDLQANVQTSFVPLGGATRLKRFLMVRAGLRSLSQPALQLALNSEWDFTPPGLSPVYAPAGASTWDSGVWDTAVWSGTVQTYKEWTGASGVGHFASLAFSLRGRAGTQFTDWDCVVEPGGLL